MRHAPRQGEIPPTPAFHPPVARGGREQWQTAGELARTFWQHAAADDRISPDFRSVARERAGAIDTALQEPKGGPMDAPGW
jgi:hypothetical protein